MLHADSGDFSLHRVQQFNLLNGFVHLLFANLACQQNHRHLCLSFRGFFLNQRFDTDGAITLLGREDDIMNAGGFRVAPAEIEEVISRHPAAGDVAAAELQVGPATSIIALFWTGTAPREELQRLAESELARYKQPREYRRLDALPRTATGKINRRALRQVFGEQQHDNS